jgi:hypothetical protein
MSTIASSINAGVIKIGSGLAITSDGVLSQYPVIINTIPEATVDTLGLVKIGYGLQVTNRIVDVNIPSATGTDLGLVRIGEGLSITSDGTVSLSIATSTTIGLVKVPIGSGITVNPDGKIWLDSTLPISRTGIDPLDFSLSNMFSITPTSSFAFPNPINIILGKSYYVIIHGSTGLYVSSWGSYFQFQGSTPTQLEMEAGTFILNCQAFSSTEIFVTSVNYF